MFEPMDPVRDVLRVVLADDHHFFREGLRDMLVTSGISVVGEAKDYGEALALAGSLEPDVIVINLDISEATGPEALRGIAAVSPRARIVVLANSTEDGEALDALKAGACGYILKDVQADDLVGGIRLTVGGHAVLSRKLMRTLVARASPDDDGGEPAHAVSEAPALTAREKDVLRLLASGADNATIGLELSISRHTVKQHVTNIFEKLGVRSRVEAAVYAVRAGLI
jgi:two-component system, NarL family, nitrate/nitrite response regulator NarL